MSVWDLAVVGAGPAGVAAWAEAARQGARAVILDATGRAGGTIRIAYEVRNLPFLDDGVGGQVVADHLASYLRRWGGDVRALRATRVSWQQGHVRIETRQAEVVEAHRVVLALGTEPVLPAIEGLPADSRLLAGSAPAACERGTPARAVVIGGSDVAMDQARWLRAQGTDVRVLVRAQVRAPAWLVEAVRRDGVVIDAPARAVRARALDGQVVLTVRQGELVEERRVDRVVAAVGRRAAELAGADALVEAFPERIRVVGDGTGRRARHVVAALGDGCVAAAELLARPAGGSR